MPAESSLDGGGLDGGSLPKVAARAQKLETLADGRAVSYFDYDWRMERVDGGEVTGTLGSGLPA